MIRDELIQRREEGYDVTDLEEKLKEPARKTQSELYRILKELEECPRLPDFPYREPSEISEIKRETPKEPERFEVALSEDRLLDKIYGAWLGRCAGCLLGKPVEGLKKEEIETYLKTAEAYPLRNYFPPLYGFSEDAPRWLVQRINWIMKNRIGVLQGSINCMVRDDDIDYTIMGLHILEKYGFEFTTMNAGDSWLSLLPYQQVFTAERAAYRNLVNGLDPPQTAVYMNPYREWIGAQIRADMWGYVTPGAPELAAELAYRDARLSHVKNGIYGEMFVSAMISTAFAVDDVSRIIEAGMSVIPEKSRLAEAVRDVVAWSREFSSWEDAWRKVMEKYGHYHRVHTINNAALALLGLLYGNSDYEKSITISVMGGLDTDCNGATTGSIIGLMLGAKELPEKWIEPLNDRVESFVIGYNNSRISDLAKRTSKIATGLLKRN